MASAREIARTYELPYQLLSKILQRLQTAGFVRSVQGTKGGYLLAKDAEEITIADLVQALDGPIAVAYCLGDNPEKCQQVELCNIRQLLETVNIQIKELLDDTTLASLVASSAPRCEQPGNVDFPVTVGGIQDRSVS